MEWAREHYCPMIFYDFKARLNQKECVQQLQLAFGDESSYHATVFRWLKNFCSGHNSLQDEEPTERPRSAVIPDDVFSIQKMFMNDKCCTYQIMQKELNFGSAAMCKIIQEELHMRKIVCCWVPHNLSTKKRCVSESVKKSLKLLNNGGHSIISKIVMGLKTY
ncbi:histone-lysine N-methyltransferase SETMAR [Trichonephila clavipes]|nr:histone-lysine N-methyltransferase SETMAR [Trichonephila clavipes]